MLELNIFHLSIYRFLPTALLGMLITYAVIETRSILAGVIIHFGVNAIVFSSGIYPSLNKLLGMQDEQIVDWTRLAGFGAVLVLGLLFVRSDKKTSKN